MASLAGQSPGLWEEAAVRWPAMLGDRALRHEWPTWLLIVTIYAGWLALTWFWTEMPLWVAVPLGAWFCAWHMSLQHELMHGHPTRSTRVNTALAWPPLNLWLPYPIYRESHLRHHRAEHLADPLDDPESTYMAAEDWARASPARRWLHGACNTLTGRLVFGPACTIVRFWHGQLRGSHAGRWSVWLGHAAGAGLILVWVCLVCRISLLAYLAGCVYPATALIMVRSLAEHRASERVEDRTAVVERAGLLGVLFLNNNLHVLHHACPSLPWFALPAQWRLRRAQMLAAGFAPVYPSYLDVARRFALRPQHPGPYPAQAKPVLSMPT